MRWDIFEVAQTLRIYSSGSATGDVRCASYCEGQCTWRRRETQATQVQYRYRLKRASELTERVLHTHMFLFPSHQFGKVRDRSDRTAEKKENRIFGSPKAWKHPSFPHPSRPGWACYTAGRRTDAPHHTSTVHQPTRTHLRHTHTHTPPHPSGLTRTNAHQPAHPTGSPRRAYNLPHPGAVRVACDSPMTGLRETPAVRSLPHTRRRETRKKKQKHNHHRDRQNRQGSRKRPPGGTHEDVGKSGGRISTAM